LREVKENGGGGIKPEKKVASDPEVKERLWASHFLSLKRI
jgi:hypothetical protein